MQPAYMNHWRLERHGVSDRLYSLTKPETAKREPGHIVMLNRHREAIRHYRRAFPEILRYAILFRLLEAVVLMPLAALMGQALSGRAVVDSTELVAFAMSPRGFLALFCWGTLFLAIRLVEQAGLSAIVLGTSNEKRVTALSALAMVARVMPKLVALSVWILLTALLLLLPLLAVAAYYARKLLKEHDINYFIAQRPPEFMRAIAVTAAVALPTLAAAVWIAVRWRLVVPATLCERGSARAMLASSARLVRGNWRPMATAWLISLLLVLGLGLLAAWLGRVCGLAATRLTAEWSEHPGIFAGLLVLRTVLTGLVTLPAPCVTAGVFATFYCDIRRARDPGWQPAIGAETGARRGTAIGRWLLAALPLIVIGLSFIITIQGMEELYADRPVAVTAHRGGTTRSVENTLSAVREAVEEGAQFAEIDVQTSRDGVLVVTHDSDFSRLAGVARKVWEMTHEEIQAVALTREGSAQKPDRVPTLEQVLTEARGRIRLNIELKYYGDHQPQLAERVLEAVRRFGMEDQVVIQSLHYAGLEEIRRLAPRIPIGYLFSVNAREPERLDVDFLSVQLGRVDRSFVSAAHRRGLLVHVWTVNKPEDMQRLIDLGVDNLITDRPKEALQLAHAQAQRSPTERAMRRLHTWLLD